MHEVNGPADIRARRNRQWLRVSRGQALLAFAPEIHLQKTIYPVDAFMIPAKTVSAQYREQFAETVTRIPVGQSQKRFNDRRIISRFGRIPVHRPAKAQRSACLPFTEAMLTVHEIR